MTYQLQTQVSALGTRLLTRREAAELLNVRPQTLACWACSRRYDLPFIKIGRRVMYSHSDIEQFLERNKVGGEVLQ